MTLVWFVIWLVENVIGGDEPVTFDAVNWWAGTLILVAALDLARQHAPALAARRTATRDAQSRRTRGSR